MKTNVYILTGGVGTGKTTALQKWIQYKKATGVLTPVVENVRKAFSIADACWFNLEARPGEAAIPVGRYIFSATAFVKMNQILLESLQKECDWIVVDEVGPLELRKGGLHDAVKVIIEKATCNVLLVVRDELVDNVIDYFNVRPTIVDKLQLAEL